MTFCSLFLTNENFLEFNLNLLETNTLNIFLLLALLLSIKKTSFDPILEQRQSQIYQTLEAAQNDLLTSLEYYYLCEKVSKQTSFWLKEWKLSYKEKKKSFFQKNYLQVKKLVQENSQTTKILIKNVEKKSLFSLQKFLKYFIAGKLLRKFLSLSKKEKSKFITKTLSLLRGYKK